MDSDTESESKSSINSENERDESIEDWYADSDTSEEVPDPNDDPVSLYQEYDCLPVSLSKKHFIEGLIYTIVLQENKSIRMLAMVIETKRSSFTYRVFNVIGSSRKTYHQGANDKVCDYSAV